MDFIKLKREAVEKTKSDMAAFSQRMLTITLVLVGLAVLREGSEVVLFLYGIFASGTSGTSLLIGGLILSSSVRLLKEALHGTLDGVPAHIDLDGLGRRLASVPGVREVHDLHVWPIGAERLALSAHVRLDDLASWPQMLGELSEIAGHQGIEHVTFQPESIRSIQAEPVSFIKH